LVEKFVKEFKRDENSMMSLTLASVLAAFGVDPAEIVATKVDTEDYKALMATQIARHLKSS
jgi:hypothetical protein